MVAWGRCRQEESLAAKRRALEYARRVGKTRRERSLLGEIGITLLFGPVPAEEALRWYEEHRRLEAVRPGLAAGRGRLLGFLGRFDEGRKAIAEAADRARELDLQMVVAMAAAEGLGELELLAGDAAEAERQILVGLEVHQLHGAFGVASTYAGFLARALLALDRDDEAERWTHTSEELGAADDVVTQVLWRQARARVLARRHEHASAGRLAREAVTLAEETDMPKVRGDALIDHAEVLELGGDADGAAVALERALAEYQQKGVIPAAERARARLSALRAPA